MLSLSINKRCICFCVALIIVTITLLYYTRHEHYSPFLKDDFVLCRHPNHKSIHDCQRDLFARTWKVDGDYSCEITNIMFYTVQIRKKRNMQYYYRKVTRVFDYIREHNMEFPLECRHIGSMLTNIYQCSSNSLERALAQGLNMFIQFEKLHIMSKRSEHQDSSCYFEPKSDVEIFERYSCRGGDLFRNVYIRDMQELNKFPNLLFLYKRALRLLLKEHRSITYNIYHHSNDNEKHAINTYLQI